MSFEMPKPSKESFPYLPRFHKAWAVCQLHGHAQEPDAERATNAHVGLTLRRGMGRGGRGHSLVVQKRLRLAG